MDIFKILEFSGILGGDFLGILWEFYRNSLAILWQFFGNSLENLSEFFGNSIRILEEFLRNSWGILWEFLDIWICKELHWWFCQDFGVRKKEGQEIRSLEVREAKSSHLKIVLVIEKPFEIWGWRPRICELFEITRTIYSNSESSEQFLKH